MTTTHDINTAAAAPAPAITDLPGLTTAVFTLAGRQLLIDQAKAHMQANIEAQKKAFEDATQHIQAEIDSTFAAVQAYCTDHKDSLFPIKKNGQRQKTFQVLQHKLQYRESTNVEAPEMGAEIIEAMIHEISADAYPDPVHGLPKAQLISALKAMIRQPMPELNKDNVRAIIQTNNEIAADLDSRGIRLVKEETFKVAFTFTPEA